MHVLRHHHRVSPHPHPSARRRRRQGPDRAAEGLRRTYLHPSQKRMRHQTRRGSNLPIRPSWPDRHWIVDAAHIRAPQSLPGKVGKKHRALARWIGVRIQDNLRFAVDPNAPFVNNAAERETRMAKLRQKVSGGKRTLVGAEHFAALPSISCDYCEARHRWA
ncbi:hypothetical protein FEZ60_30400 [Rhodococcus sp. MS16]|nr:hypothetical protein [Rhodococcus sp. MS16]